MYKLAIAALLATSAAAFAPAQSAGRTSTSLNLNGWTADEVRYSSEMTFVSDGTALFSGYLFFGMKLILIAILLSDCSIYLRAFAISIVDNLIVEQVLLRSPGLARPRWQL